MENRDIRIAFFDIDGTLLPPDHHLPESTVAALNILRAKGVQLYLATGRPPYHLHYLKKDLPFEFDGMVMMNGGEAAARDEGARKGAVVDHPAAAGGTARAAALAGKNRYCGFLCGSGYRLHEPHQCPV